MGILDALVSALVPKEATIERLVVNLEREGTIVGTWVRGLRYDDVIRYIMDKKCRIVRVEDHVDYKWIEFETWIGGNNYLVTLSKAWNDDGSYGQDAVISSRLGDI